MLIIFFIISCIELWSVMSEDEHYKGRTFHKTDLKLLYNDDMNNMQADDLILEICC